MAFQNYFVASNLSDLGRNMAADTMNQREQQRLMAAQLMQAMAQREQQAQQQQQFQQELAYRQQSQQQENQYKNALLAMQQQQNQFTQTGTTPGMEWDNQYKYAALANQLKIAEAQAKSQQFNIGQQGAAAWINQQGQNYRDQGLSDEAWEDSKAEAEAKAAMWNARIQNSKNSLFTTEKKDKAGEWTTTDSGAETWAKLEWPKRYSALVNELSQIDKSPGLIAPDPKDPSGETFIAVVKPKRQQRFFPGMVNPYGQADPSGQQAVFLSTDYSPASSRIGPSRSTLEALRGTESMSRTNAPAAVVQSGTNYQQEVAQLQAAVKAGLLDRANYILRRQQLDAKYGISTNSLVNAITNTAPPISAGPVVTNSSPASMVITDAPLYGPIEMESPTNYPVGLNQDEIAMSIKSRYKKGAITKSEAVAQLKQLGYK